MPHWFNVEYDSRTSGILGNSTNRSRDIWITTETRNPSRSELEIAIKEQTHERLSSDDKRRYLTISLVSAYYLGNNESYRQPPNTSGSKYC